MSVIAIVSAELTGSQIGAHFKNLLKSFDICIITPDSDFKEEKIAILYTTVFHFD